MAWKLTLINFNCTGVIVISIQKALRGALFLRDLSKSEHSGSTNTSFLDEKLSNFWSYLKVEMLELFMMPPLCGLLQVDPWELSTLKKVLFFLNTPQVLHFGAGAHASRELSSYLELCLTKVIYDFRFPCFELVFIGSFSFGMRIWVRLMRFC